MGPFEPNLHINDHLNIVDLEIESAAAKIIQLDNPTYASGKKVV